MQINWAPEHSEALRECVASGMSHSEAARAINARFKTVYSRNAVIGRAKRMGLATPDRLAALPWSRPEAKPPQVRREREGQAALQEWLGPLLEPQKRIALRCIQIVPRNLDLMELESGDCRYPYGGDDEGEAITFCGHPRREGSSYCLGHFHLTRGPGTASERSAVAVALRLVQAA
jgi:GcrA cell cycle regulator